MKRPNELRWSYSILSELQRCPAQAALHISGEPAIISDAIKTGQETHSAIARYAEHCLSARKRRDVEKAEEIALSLTDERGRILTANFAKAAVFPTNYSSYFVEQELQRDTEWGIFRGVVDLLIEVEQDSPFGSSDKLCIIFDWKTGRAPDDEKARMQLATYIWLAGYTQATAYLGVIENNFWGVREYHFDSLDIERHERWLVAQIERWANEEEWEEQPGTHCGYCLYVYSCPLQNSETMRKLTMSVQGAFGLWQWYEAQAKAMRSIVQEHAKQQGPLDMGADGVWGYAPIHRRQLLISSNDIIQRAFERGVEVPIDIDAAIKRGLLTDNDYELVAYSKRFGRIEADD